MVEKCCLRLHATVLSKSSVLQFYNVGIDEGDPKVDRTGIASRQQVRLVPDSGVSLMNAWLLWRANWDVLIKRGKRELLTFYDVKEG